MLSVDQILQSGAYALNVPPKGEPFSDRKHQKRYLAWFDPKYDYNRAYHVHAQPERQWGRNFQQELDALLCDICRSGLRNPVLATHRGNSDDGWVLHPGKCRTWAIKQLGIEYIPAICVDYRPTAEIPDGCYEIIGIEHLRAHFCKDVAPEMTHKVLRIPRRRHG